jgi:hypothetical protein
MERTAPVMRPRDVRAFGLRALDCGFLRRLAVADLVAVLPATRSSAMVREFPFDRDPSNEGSMRLRGVFLRAMKGPDAVLSRRAAQTDKTRQQSGVWFHSNSGKEPSLSHSETARRCENTLIATI